MDEENYTKKVLTMSLAGLLFGSLFFIFGLSIKSSILPMIINYIIALLLYISSLLAVHNNNKNKIRIFTYVEYLTIFMIIFITAALFLQLT